MKDSVGTWTRVLVTQSLDPTILPQFSRLTADLAGAIGFLLGDFDTLAHGVVCMIHVDA